MTGWTAAVLAATALHAGFQATVTLLVYPALADVGHEGWQAAHGSHSRRIVPLVAIVYGAAVVSCVGALVDAPGSPGVLVAAAGTGGAVLVTATLAAPTHGRLADAPEGRLLARLLVVDRARLVLALVALAGAVLAAVPNG